jgi:hypothetical protein
MKRKARKESQLAARKRAKQEKAYAANAAAGGHGGSKTAKPPTAVSNAVAPPTFKGINKNSFQNDGSFLSMLAATKKAKE